MNDGFQALKELGDLHEVRSEVDWNLELAAITRRGLLPCILSLCDIFVCAAYDLRAPAPLFTCIKDKPNMRVLGAPCGLSKADNMCAQFMLRKPSSFRMVLQQIQRGTSGDQPRSACDSKRARRDW